MYLIPADVLHRSLLVRRKPQEQVKIRKYQEQVKKLKHHPYDEEIKICKHHPYEEWLKVCQTIDEQILEKDGEECNGGILNTSNSFRAG